VELRVLDQQTGRLTIGFALAIGAHRLAAL
jgi:hypothetical protein